MKTIQRLVQMHLTLGLCLMTACRKVEESHGNSDVKQSARGTFVAYARIVDNEIRISVQSQFDEWVLLECTPDAFPIGWAGKSGSGAESIIGGDRFGKVVSKREQWTILPKRAGPNVKQPCQYTLSRPLPEGFPVSHLKDLNVSVILTYITRTAGGQTDNDPLPATQTLPLVFQEAPVSLEGH